jgi:superfamily I DNA/RNA helicase
VSVACDGIVAVPLTLLPPSPVTPSPVPDDVQRAVLAHRGPALLVRGAAGTGKTTTALALAVDRVSSGALAPEDVLLLAPTRRAAARLRDELSARLVRTTGQPVVRTAASAAFSVLRARASLLGEPPPALITGPEQDLVLADLLEGHAAGEGAAVRWPPSVPREALGLRAFRDELRDLLMRAAERGLRPEDLERLGRRHHRPEWVAAAAVYDEYLAVTRLRTGTPDLGSRFDPAVVVDEAAEALRAWEREVPAAARPRWSLVVVDDYQEATAATARLLHAVMEGGADLVLLADPDSAVQTFRGASPGLVDRASVGPVASELGAFAADELTLPVVRRHGAALRAAVSGVTRHIHGPDRASRVASAPDDAPTGEVRVALLRSPAQEAAYVASVLRSARLHEDLPWNRMAVVVRSGAQVGELRRALLGAQVPVTVVGSDLPLRAEPAVRPLLLAASCAIAVETPSAEDVATLLTSPLGGLDSVGLRRLRRTLRAEEVALGGGRASDALLVELVTDPDRVDALPTAVRRPVRRVVDVLTAAARAAQAADATVLDVLWAVWDTSGLAEPWRRVALAGGPAGARSDRDLDAVLALFKAAEQFVDRLPRAPVTAFLEHLQSQDLPADSLAAQGDTTQAVALLTAAGAAGGEWDLVVVAGVQEGTWPDLRLRDSMLGAQQLVDLLAGRGAPGTQDAGAARTAVLDDELRAFAVAVSRATTRLLVTAVDDADHQPSAFLDLVDPAPDDDEADRDRHVTVPGSLDLRGTVARVRALLEEVAGRGEVDGTHRAAALLARLAREEVPGAHPDAWTGVRPDSTAAPLWEPGATVTLSPSRLEAVSTCALRWALEEAGGRPGRSGEQSLGTLLHEVAAAVPDGDQARLEEELDRRWPRLGLTEGWIAAAQRRRADKMLDHLGRYLRSGHDVVAVEREFEVDLGGVVLRGAVDRLERLGHADDGAALVRVVDLKTGRSAASQDETGRHAQLGAYQVAVEAGAFDDLVGGPARSAGAALVYVGTTNKNVTLRNQTALAEDPEPQWASALVEEVAGTVSRSVMAARENALCRVCPVRRSCPLQDEGRTVGA